MEEGFGVVYTNNESFGPSGIKAIDRYHLSNKEK
jgi:hypothetical protein